MKLLNGKTFKDVFFSSKWRLWIIETRIYSLWLHVIEILVSIWLYYFIRIVHWWYSDLYNYSMLQKILEFSLLLIGIWIGVLLIIMDIFLLIKRAHDLWKKWSRLRCLLIPIYNLFIIIQLSFFPWEKHDNQYWKYNNEKLPTIVYIILIVEVIMVFWYKIFWKQPDFPFRDRPFIEYGKWLDENNLRDDEWSDSFDEEARKEFENIVNSKLNCNCFWDNPTEKPTVKIDRKFWEEVYSEFETKLLELANDPKYSIVNTEK